MELSELCSPEEYQAGKTLYNSRRVRIVSEDSFWKGEKNLTATVQEEEFSCTVSVLLRDGEVERAVCSCGEGRLPNRLCRHQTALLLFAEEQTRRESAVPVMTSPDARALLRTYTEKNYEEALYRTTVAKVKLKPVVHVKRRQILLGFRIGQGKFYVLKNLREFADQVNEHRQVAYGKSLSFLHGTEAFDEESRPWLDLILEEMEREARAENQFGAYHRGGQVRELALEGSLLDRFYELVPESGIEALDDEDQPFLFRTADEDPKIPVDIEPCGSDGIHIRIAERWMCYEGRNRLYLRREDSGVLCRTSSSYGEALSPFFRTMCTAYRRDDVTLQKRDIPSFCEEILPVLEQYLICTEAPGAELDDYRGQVMKVSFYFDRPDADSITLEIRLRCGDHEYDPLNEKVEMTHHNISREYHVRQVAGKYFPFRTDSGQLIIRGDDDAAFRLMTDGMPEFLALGDVFATEAFRELKIRRRSGIRPSVTNPGHIMMLSLKADDMDQDEILRVLESYRLKRRFHRLKSGDFLELSDPKLASLAEVADSLHLKPGDAAYGAYEVPAYRACYVEEVLSEGNWSVRRTFTEKLRESKIDPIPDELVDVMRDYQKQGFAWMSRLCALGFGGILADDMGLGKTLQMIALILAKKEEGIPSLVVCPSSLVFNWKMELEKFAPGLRAVMVIGTAAERQAILNSEEQCDVWLTSYELLRRDRECYEEKELLFVVADEAQYIKNQGTQNARSVKALKARYRFALTGTPIENRISELWSIYDFLMPGFLGSYDSFREEYELPILKGEGAEKMLRLKKMIRPFLLRRMKSDVLFDLPERTEEVVYSQLAGEQKKLYHARVNEIRRMLENSDEEECRKNRMVILTELLRLRQICCDPALVYDRYEGESVKTDTCLEYVRRAVEGGHKVLLFSTFSSMLARLAVRLKAEGISFFLLDGSTKKEERQRMTGEFETSDVPVFLISMKAGGTGLNLTAADVVILYDPWWNPAVENQAADRAYRIGQTKPVTVYRMVAADTLEDRIQEMKAEKMKIVDDILEGSGGAQEFLTRENLMELLAE